MNNYLKIRELTAVCLIILAIAAVGCGKNGTPAASRVDLAKDGTLKAVMISSFNKNYYDIDELRNGIAMAVEEYNSKAGGYRIELKEVVFDGDTAEVVMNYRTAADYAAFNNVTFFSGTVEEGIANETLPGDITLHPVKEGLAETTPRDLAKEKKPGHFLVFMEPLSVKVPGSVTYLSDGLTVDDEGRIAVAEELIDGSTLSSLVYVFFS